MAAENSLFTRTENGALSYRSSGSMLLDFFYHAAARRGGNISELFNTAYASDPIGAIVASFNLRDVRGGKGERTLFRQALHQLRAKDDGRFQQIVHLVPEYGRWDDLIDFYSDPTVVDLISGQLAADVESTSGVSLLAKWMPSENATSKTTRALARAWTHVLSLTAREYRQLLSTLRRRIGIVETAMSQGRWEDIKFEAVPSRAAMIYRKAFSKHDGERYGKYIEAVKAGKSKINAGTLFPYELVQRVLAGQYSYHSTAKNDATLDVQWDALPDYTEGKSFITICDTSGSMMTNGYGGPRPLDVAISLALYSAERAQGLFHNKWINFNNEASLKIVKGRTLSEKVASIHREQDWGGSTNVQSALQLLLTQATRAGAPQDDMPKVLFIVSDMQFNATGLMTNYEQMRRRFQLAGYEAPTIVFWNVNSRVNETPVQQHESGAFLVSGCSPSVFKQALRTSVATPVELMQEVLHDERYDAVWAALA